MKKTLVALAALASVSAFAQTTVTLSGRASMDVSTFQATGSTAGEGSDYKNRVRIADTSSRITFAAQEDLSGGNKAGVYCETGININNASGVGAADTANANTTTWCSREGRAYLGNNDVEVRLGRQNVWWTQGELNEVGSTQLGADSLTNLINGGVGVYTVRGENQAKLFAGQGMGAFAGSEAYWGMMGAAGQSTTSNVNGQAATAGNSPNAKYFGGKLLYTRGEIVGMIDYQNSQASAKSTGSTVGTVYSDSFDRKSTKYGLGYKYAPGSIVSVQYWTKSRTDRTTAGATYVSPFAVSVTTAAATTAGDAKDSGYGIVLKHDLGGTYVLHAQYGKANNLKNGAGDSQADTGATAYSLGLTKDLSKRTHLYTAYHVINNKANAAYNMSGGNYSSAGTLYQGADIKQLAFGLIHNF